jgi:hypothetical protein
VATRKGLKAHKTEPQRRLTLRSMMKPGGDDDVNADVDDASYSAAIA